ncbi:hypothetical protein K438DRAFT_1758169 [Mycena galopus ATCC 62051]|nr:hypothetical protein K438DRAFT_1758169 [Mycena galopus ATCC 62051]
MSAYPMDPRDVLISLVTAALTAAEADAAECAQFPITSQDAHVHLLDRMLDLYFALSGIPHPELKVLSWTSVLINQLSPPPLLSASPPSASTSVPSPPVATASMPASLLSPGHEDAVTELLKKNQDVFDKVINHPFPRALGKGTASLGLPILHDYIETFEFHHKSSIEYVKKLKEICITMLGIPESTVNTLNTPPRSAELDAREHFYKVALGNEEKALLGYYVVLLPCILTYWRIAEHVVYHAAWTVVNYDPSSVNNYTTKGGLDRWSWVFRIACQLEAKLFNTGLKAPTPFRVIPDGTFSIHNSSAESIVLAIQNVTASLPAPLDKPPGGSFVVGMKKNWWG